MVFLFDTGLERLPLGLALIAVLSTSLAIYQAVAAWMTRRRALKVQQALEADQFVESQRLALKGRIAELEERDQVQRDELKRLTLRNSFMAREIASDPDKKTRVMTVSRPGRTFNEDGD
jgi:hypothetical protein